MYSLCSHLTCNYCYNFVGTKTTPNYYLAEVDTTGGDRSKRDIYGHRVTGHDFDSTHNPGRRDVR